MEKYIQKFLEFKTGGRLKKHSAKSYRSVLYRFKSIVSKPITKLHIDDIIKYRQILSLGYAPKTIQYHFTIIHCFIKFWNPEVKTISHERIEVPQARSNPHPTVEEWEHKQLLSVLDDNNYDHLQKRLFLSLLWDTGARCGEIVAINLEDIDFDNKRIRIKTEKTKKERVLFYGNDTHDTLCKILPIRWEIKRSPALFVGIYNSGEYSERLSTRTVERWLKVIRMIACVRKKIVPHSYRHSRIQRWISSGMSLIEVTYLSGHESIYSLEHYMRLGPKQIESLARKNM